MQFVVESAGVADGLSDVVPPPQRGGGGLAVGAGETHAPGRRRVALEQAGLLKLETRHWERGKALTRRHRDEGSHTVFFP